MTTSPPLTSTPAAASTSPGLPPPSPAGSRVSADTFLKLLVAQLKTQNPLEPQKGTEFVTQLAQFNTLEQLIAIRAELSALRAAGEKQAAPQQPPAAGAPAGNSLDPNPAISKA